MSAFQSPWPCPPRALGISPDEVHVWCVPLDVGEHVRHELFGYLSIDERERSGRFHFDRDRHRFIACRGRQRCILSRYLNANPQEISFRYGRLGKPALDAPWSESAIQFNLSNSADMAVLAVVVNRSIGVDVERLRPLADMDALAERFFAIDERQQLYSLPSDQRLNGFFNCWTRKEAVLKAVGTGLSFPLERIVVSLVPDQRARILSFDGDASLDAKWWMHGMEPANDYVGAVASPGNTLEVSHWLWSDG